MEEFILKIITQGGSLGTLCLVVYLFLKFGKDELRMNRDMMREMHVAHLEARREMQRSLEENVVSTRENTKAIQSLEVSVLSLAHKQQ